MRIVGVVECGVPKVRISLDESSSKSFSFSSLAVFLRISMHDPIESVMTDK